MPSPPSASSSNGSPTAEQAPPQGSTGRSGNSESSAEATSASSAEGWLEGEPVGNDNSQGEWQTSNQTVPESAGNKPSSGTTGSEKSAGANSDNEADLALTEALEGLDGDILAERAVLRETEVAKNGGNGNNQIQGADDRETASASATVAASSTAQTARGRANNRPPPPKRGDDDAATELPDAKDDDIIARQLREAAMQETDPVLKEKLWDEYRRYKKG
ncbi:MAG TPA: hypothetical protein DHU16_02380 [Gammaproteobacteria bacterium]|nr:hypothetical protein [Gammaproteobacteria bacterium]